MGLFVLELKTQTLSGQHFLFDEPSQIAAKLPVCGEGGTTKKGEEGQDDTDDNDTNRKKNDDDREEEEGLEDSDVERSAFSLRQTAADRIKAPRKKNEMKKEREAEAEPKANAEEEEERRRKTT